MKVSVVTPVMADSEQKVKFLIEAIQSVKAQTHEDWDMAIINDRSTVKFSDFPDLMHELEDDRIVAGKTPPGKQGVARARNQATRSTEGPLILPLDADDWFPKDAMEVHLEARAQAGANKPNILTYGHVKMVMNDAQRIIKAKGYSFTTLLQGLMMPVGTMHRREDHVAIGGWKPAMDQGLEDWEYWITMGEHGVCGVSIPKVTYIYRRHGHSRIAWLRTSGAYDEAYQHMRELHMNTYNGKAPAKCCGGGVAAAPRHPGRANARSQAMQMQAAQTMAAVPDTRLVQVIYQGDAMGSWGVNGKISGIHYQVMGPGMPLQMMDGRVGVDARDVPYILPLDRGKSFKVAP